MANLKDLIVNGSARVLGTIYGNLTGNASTATKATQDSVGNVILATYEKIAKPVEAINGSSIELADNTIYKIQISNDTTFVLPTVTNLNTFHQIVIQLDMSTQPYSITLGTSVYFDGEAPDLSTSGVYNLYYEYDILSQAWVCGALIKKART